MNRRKLIMNRDINTIITNIKIYRIQYPNDNFFKCFLKYHGNDKIKDVFKEKNEILKYLIEYYMKTYENL